MATILKCKICGGDISVNKEMTVGTCQYCGTTVTLPRIDSDKKARLFNRANQYRLNCEFDKAYDAYNAIASEDEQEAEAYWGMLLSEYGVEYVEDPVTKKRIPTCHRTITLPVRSSANYKLACKYADVESQFIYQDEAETLDGIQKSIISISSREEPYDVFICYKETDDTSHERTQDSVIAQDIYEALIDQGIKVFFSRITLSEKLGKDYEPYIYAALNSARVMLVVTTSNANSNSVWVKNEWSRFLRFMQDDRGKCIIPVFKGMTAYELPDELNRFQSQDMEKIGALQDLVFSVKKLLSTEAREEKDNALENLIQKSIERERRKNDFLGIVYTLRNRVYDLLKQLRKYSKIIIAVASVILCFLLGKSIYKNILVPNSIYRTGLSYIESGEYDNAIKEFNQIRDYKDAKEQICEAYYLKAKALLDSNKYNSAKEAFSAGVLSGYKDSANMILECDYQRGLALFNEEKYTDAKNVFEKLGTYSNSQDMKNECLYQIALGQIKTKAYDSAAKIFLNLGDYKDSRDMYHECYYVKANNMESERAAADIYYDLMQDSYKDSKERFEKIAESFYQDAMSAYDQKDYDNATALFEILATYSYKDSEKMISTIETTEKAEKEAASNAIQGKWRRGTEELTFTSSSVKYYDTDSYAFLGWSAKNLGQYEYEPENGYYRFSGVFHTYHATINNNTMIITSDSKASSPSPGTYTRVSN